MVDSIETPNDDIWAAELALSLLQGEDKAAALRKQLSEPGFAQKVAAWNERIHPLFDEIIDVSPADNIWDKIEDIIDNQSPIADSPRIVSVLERQVNKWKMGAIGSGALAACLAVILVLSNGVSEITADEASPVAVAQLTGPIEGLVLVASYNPDSAQMRIDVSGMPETETQPEIWIVSGNAKPQSLGQIGRDGLSEMIVASDHRSLINNMSSLVLTMEPESDVPHDAPSGEAVASGKITFI